MLTYVHGNLFISPARVLVNTVNTVGVMGKGIAKEFRRLYPAMFSEYQAVCERQELAPGKLMLYRTPHKSVLNFPTKRHWRQPARMDDVEAGLEVFARRCHDMGISSIAFPQLGCGNGGLDWESQVRPLMEHYLAPLPIDTFVYIQTGAGPEIEFPWLASWHRAEPQPLSFDAVWKDLVRRIADLKEFGQATDGWQFEIDCAWEIPIVVAKRGEEHIAIAKDDVQTVWQRFRTFGFLSPEAVNLEPDHALILLKLFASLPYVQEARFVANPVARMISQRDTVALLYEADAWGIQFVAPLDTSTEEVARMDVFQTTAA